MFPNKRITECGILSLFFSLQIAFLSDLVDISRSQLCHCTQFIVIYCVRRPLDNTIVCL
jgi:hypothetical protein